MQQKSAVSMSALCCWLCLQWMAAVYLNRLSVFMSDVYSVEEPAGLALPLWFTPAHFGLQELAKEKNRLCCCHLQTSGSTQVVLTHVICRQMKRFSVISLIYSVSSRCCVCGLKNQSRKDGRSSSLLTFY